MYNCPATIHDFNRLPQGQPLKEKKLFSTHTQFIFVRSQSHLKWLRETSGILCIFTTRNPKTLALTNVRRKKKELRPLPSHLRARERQHCQGRTCSCPLGFRSAHGRTPVCLRSLEQELRFEALISYNHQWIAWGDGNDENKTKKSKQETNQRQRQTSVANLNTAKPVARSRGKQRCVCLAMRTLGENGDLRETKGVSGAK